MLSARHPALHPQSSRQTGGKGKAVLSPHPLQSEHSKEWTVLCALGDTEVPPVHLSSRASLIHQTQTFLCTFLPPPGHMAGLYLCPLRYTFLHSVTITYNDTQLAALLEACSPQTGKLWNGRNLAPPYFLPWQCLAHSRCSRSAKCFRGQVVQYCSRALTSGWGTKWGQQEENLVRTRFWPGEERSWFKKKKFFFEEK